MASHGEGARLMHERSTTQRSRCTAHDNSSRLPQTTQLFQTVAVALIRCLIKCNFVLLLRIDLVIVDCAVGELETARDFRQEVSMPTTCGASSSTTQCSDAAQIFECMLRSLSADSSALDLLNAAAATQRQSMLGSA